MLLSAMPNGYHLSLQSTSLGMDTYFYKTTFLEEVGSTVFPNLHTVSLNVVSAIGSSSKI